MSTDLERALVLIVERAPDLIAAGVRGRVTIGDVSFELAADAAPAAPAAANVSPAAREIVDALNDPATHGQFGGDAAPRRRHERPPLVPPEFAHLGGLGPGAR